MIRLAFRNLFRQRARSAMTLAVIVFGVTGLVLSGGFVRDILIQLGEAIIHSQSGHIQVMREGYFLAGTRSPEKFLIDDPDRLAREIATVPGVKEAMARIAFSGLLNNGRRDWAIVGEGVEPDKETRLGTYMRIAAGRPLRDADRDGILVGEGVAQALRVAPGERVTLLVNTAEGALNNLDFEVVGVFQTFSKDFDAHAVRLPLAAAHELLGNNGVNAFVLSLERTGDTDRVAEALRTRLSGRGLDVRTWVQLNDYYENAVSLYQRQFGILQIIILAMVLLSVANTVNMNVFERVGEFGTMMALGSRPGAIFRLIVTESAAMGVVGGAAGIALGIVLALAISAVGIPMPPPPNANLGYTAYIRVVPSVLAWALVIGFAAPVLAALLPASRVSRLHIATALRANV